MDRAVKNLTDQSKTPIFNNTKSARFRPTRAAAGGMVRKSRTTIDDDDEDYGSHVRNRIATQKTPNFFDMDEVSNKSDRSSNNSGSLPRNASLLVNPNDSTHLNSSLALNNRPGIGVRTPSSNSGFKNSSGSLHGGSNSGLNVGLNVGFKASTGSLNNSNLVNTPKTSLSDRFTSNSSSNLPQKPQNFQKSQTLPPKTQITIPQIHKISATPQTPVHYAVSASMDKLTIDKLTTDHKLSSNNFNGQLSSQTPISTETTPKPTSKPTHKHNTHRAPSQASTPGGFSQIAALEAENSKLKKEVQSLKNNTTQKHGILHDADRARSIKNTLDCMLIGSFTF